MSTETLIRKISNINNFSEQAGDKLIIFNTKTREVTYEEGILDSLQSKVGLRHVNYYVVNSLSFTTIDQLEHKFISSDTGAITPMTMSLDVASHKGGYARLVSFVAKSNDLKSALQKALSTWIKKYSQKNPDIADSFIEHELRLKSFITQQATRQGLEIQRLSFEKPGIYHAPEHLTHTFKHICEIRNYDIEVQNKIVLNLKDIKRFRWSNVQDVQKWVGSRLKQIVQNILISKTYKQVVLNFEEQYKPLIQRRLEQEVAHIGYSVMQIVSVPSKEIGIYLRGFQFNTETDDLKDGNFRNTFPTKERDTEVKLGVFIEGSGRSVKGISEEFIAPNISVVSEIKKEVLKIIEQKIRETPPDKFFMEDPANFEADLTAILTKDLSQKFKLNCRKISISIHNTAASVRFKNLGAHTGTFEVKDFTGSAHFVVTYRVIGISNYQIFARNNYKYDGNIINEYSDISEVIKNELELIINREFGFDKNQIKSGLIDKWITQKTIQISKDLINPDFGLSIGNIRLKRLRGKDLEEGENIALKFSTLNDKIEMLSEKKKKLKLRLKDAISFNDPQEEIDELFERLEEVNKEVIQLNNQPNESLKLGQDQNLKIDQNIKNDNSTDS